MMVKRNGPPPQGQGKPPDPLPKPAAFESSLLEWPWRPLADQPIRSVKVIDDGKRLRFTLMDGRTLTYRAVGECCSESWIEHVTVPPDIEGTVLSHVKEYDGVELDFETEVYQVAFGSPKGEIVVEFRNRSNGFYGGYLAGPEERY